MAIYCRKRGAASALPSLNITYMQTIHDADASHLNAMRDEAECVRKMLDQGTTVDTRDQWSRAIG